MKASRFIPSAHKLSHDAPSRRRRPRSLCESVNSPCLGDADRVRFANRSIPRRRRLAKIPAFVSALTLSTPAPLFSSGRADNACTNLLGYLVRCVRTRGIAETIESGKTADFRSVLCRTHSPRTTSCD